MAASKRKKKFAILSILALAVLAVIAFVAMKAKNGSKQEAKLPVKVGKSEIADVQVKVTEVGNVQPEVKVDVKSNISGKVISIFHRDGDTVKRGGSIVVPAFAVERTQKFLFLIKQMMEAGQIPRRGNEAKLPDPAFD